MVTKEYAKAYREVIEIFKHMSQEDLQCIPKEKIEFYKNNMDTSYDFKLDETKDFQEQELLKTTEAVLANLFRDYWATPYQRERIKAKERYDIQKEEELKSEKYSVENLFANRLKDEKPITETINNSLVEPESKSFIERIVGFIKRIVNKIEFGRGK